MHKIFVALAFALLALVPAAAPPASAQFLDRIVAVVNGDVISLAELDSEVSRVEKSIAADGTQALPSREELRERILDLIINKRLQLQRGRALGIELTDGSVSSLLDEYRRENGLTEDRDYRSFLWDLGVSPREFEKIFREDMLIQEAMRRDVFPYMNISEEEIQRQVRKQREGRVINQYRINHILLEISPGLSDRRREELKATAGELRARHVEGETFESLAAVHSDAPNSLEGGSLGWRDASQLPDEFLLALREMQPGDVSPVIETGNGFHLIHLGDVREIPVDIGQMRVKLRIITLDAEADGAYEFAEGLYAQLVDGASFGDLAREHSIDPGSRDEGGDIGWLNMGDLLPALGSAVTRMGIGEISRPVESPLGLHIINLLDQQSEAFSEDILRARALQNLQERHLLEARRDWINLLRSNARIEIKEIG